MSQLYPDDLSVPPILTPDDLRMSDDIPIRRMATRLGLYHYRAVAQPARVWVDFVDEAARCFSWRDYDERAGTGVECVLRLHVDDVPLLVVELYRRRIPIEDLMGFDDFLDDYERLVPPPLH